MEPCSHKGKVGEMRRFWRRYRGFARCSMEMRMAYRMGFFFNWLSSLIGLLVSLFLWRVLFQTQSTIQGYDWNQMILYALIVAMLNATLSFGTEMNLSEKILDGSIASDLTKPVDIQHMSFFQALGESAVEGGISLAVISVMAILLTDLSEFLCPSRILMFVLSLILAFLLKFCLAYLGGLLCFFTSNGFGVVYLRQVITDIFSGAMLPLSFYPLWFQKVSGVLPFQASVYLPTQIFLGRVEGKELATTLLIQVFWVAALWVGGRFCFRLAIRKITIQGG